MLFVYFILNFWRGFEVIIGKSRGVKAKSALAGRGRRFDRSWEGSDRGWERG